MKCGNCEKEINAGAMRQKKSKMVPVCADCLKMEPIKVKKENWLAKQNKELKAKFDDFKVKHEAKDKDKK